VIVIKGALDMQSKTVKNIEVPLEKVSMIEANKNLDSVERYRIYNDGYSRIPVFEKERTNILGYIMVKELVLQKGDMTPKDMKLMKFTEVNRETKLYDLLKIMRESSNHMCLVQDDNKHPTGICTLEDLLEELLQAPIIDEFDTVLTNDPGKQLRIAKAIESLGLENRSDVVQDFPRFSVDVLLRRRDDHPLTKEIMRGSLDLRGNRMMKNPESGRVSLDMSRTNATILKKSSNKKKKGYGQIDDEKLLFEKDDQSIDL